MSNALSKISAAILAVVLLYLVPAVQSAEREEDYRALAAYNTLVQFVDAVRNKGFLSPRMYEEFVKELSAISGEYKIELEHRHKKYHPEYSDPADARSFLDSFSIHDEAYYDHDILPLLFSEQAPAGPSGNPRYEMNIGDFFTVTITRMERTPHKVLTEFLYVTAQPVGWNTMNYGGMVLNEDY